LMDGSSKSLPRVGRVRGRGGERDERVVGSCIGDTTKADYDGTTTC